MERWQKDVIVKYLPKLYEWTSVNRSLLTYLQTRGILGNDDIQIIESETSNCGLINGSKKLYDILQTRVGGYDALLEALLQTRQTGAAKILQHGQDQYQDQNQPSDSSTPSDVDKPWKPPAKDDLADNNVITFTQGVEKLDHFISDESSGRLVLIFSMAPILTASKVKDTIHGERNENTQKWRQAIGPFSYFHTPNEKKIKLVVPYDNLEEYESEVRGRKLNDYFRKFMQYVIKHGNKVVMVLPEELRSLEIWSTIDFTGIDYSGKVTELDDNFRWNDLHETSQSQLLNQTVYDQGRLTKLVNICESYVYENAEEFRENFLKDKLLVDLIINQKPPIIFRQTIPPVRGNYIKRRVRSRQHISPAIFQSSSPDEILVISGINDLDHLKEIAGSVEQGSVITSGDLHDENFPNARFIELDDDEDFAMICSKYKYKLGIHKLDFKDGQLMWKMTIGRKMESLHQNICDQTEEQISGQETLFDDHKTENPLVICDSAGMGKTILLAQLALETRKRTQDKGSIVLFFVLADFIASVKSGLEKKGQNTTETLDSILISEIKRNANSYDMDKSLYFTGSKLYLFFDGLDEVPVDSVPLAFECFDRLRKIAGRAKFHVTTRPHLLHRLEESLGTLGYNILPFNKTDQANFLYKYWSHFYITQKIGINTTALTDYTNNCLSAINKILTKKDQDIAGIPMQCLLIAEIFEDEAKRWAKVKTRKRGLNAKPKIQIKSLPNLYELMVKRKLESFRTRYLTNNELPYFDKSLIALHYYLSIERLFPGSMWPDKFGPILLNKEVFKDCQLMSPGWEASYSEFSEGKNIPRESIIRIGILEAADEESKLQFRHRTFAEYFVATFAINSNQKQDQSGVSLFQEVGTFIDQAVLETYPVNIDISKNRSLQQESFDFKLPVVAHFINSILQDNAEIMTTASCKGTTKILQACVLQDFRNLFVIYFNQSQPEDAELLKTLQMVAITTSSTNMLDLIKVDPKLHSCPSPTLLHFAVERGDYSMVVHLMSCYGFLETVQQRTLPEWRLLVCDCVANTRKANLTDILERIKIMEYFETKSPGIIYEITKDFLPSILSFSINIDFLLVLANHIYNINPADESKTNMSLLHVAAEHLSVDDYANFLKLMKIQLPELLKRLIAFKDEFDQTALHSLVRNLDPTPCILSIFAEFQADFHAVDDTGYTALSTAIRAGRCLESLGNLLAYYSLDWKDDQGRTAFHIVSQHCKDNKILDLLVQRGCNVNAADNWGNTPIFYAIRNTNSRTIISDLIYLKAKMNDRNNMGETALHLAAQQGNLPAVMKLSQYFLTESSRLDGKDNTPLHYALRASIGDRWGTVKYLNEEFPSDVRRKNKQGKHPFEYAINREYPDVFGVFE